MEVTEAPSVHRATELVCQFYQQFIYKAFIPKQLSRICTLHLRRSLCRRHLRDIAFTSVPSVTPCAYYIRVLVYHSIFRKNHFSKQILIPNWRNNYERHQAYHPLSPLERGRGVRLFPYFQVLHYSLQHPTFALTNQRRALESLIRSQKALWGVL